MKQKRVFDGLLNIASRAGAFLVVKHLVAIDKANKSKIKKDEPNSTALCYASGRGHLDTVKYLIEECGVTIDDKIITAANRRGEKNIKDYLLEQQKKQKLNQDQ